MTHEQLLKRILETGQFPKVRASESLMKSHLMKYAESDIGQVKIIKQRSIAVMFDGMFYHRWFDASKSVDKRSAYMRDLELIEEGKAKAI